MKTMLMILFALVSVLGAAQAIGQPAASPQSTSIKPTYPLWCVGWPKASFRRLRWKLWWACEHGANCSPLIKGGRCHDLDFYSRASYAFNDYYQKNPIPQNCDFEGTAVLTTQDPSTATCKFPSNSTSPYPVTSSVTRTTTPNLGCFLWGPVFTYLAYLAAQIV